MIDPSVESRINKLERQLSQLLAGQEAGVVYSTANVTNPPTDAELDSAFDTPANLRNGFVGFVNDNGGDTNGYFCVVMGGVWVTFSGTVAV